MKSLLAAVAAADVVAEVSVEAAAACEPAVDFRRRAECRGLLALVWERVRVVDMAVALVLVAARSVVRGQVVARRLPLGRALLRAVGLVKAARDQVVAVYPAELVLALAHALALAASAILAADDQPLAN